MTRFRLHHGLQSAALLAAMAALAGLLGWILFGAPGLWAALLGPVLAVAMHGASPRMILRLTRASPIAPWQAPGLHQLVAELAARARLPRVPGLYYVPSAALNAFAAGGQAEPAIAVTDGLLRSLGSREIAGVLAHELAHLRAHDVWVMTLAEVVGRLTTLFSFAGQLLLVVWVPLALFSSHGLPLLPIVLLIFAPAISSALQLALARTREYDADLAAVELTGDPRGLAAALLKLERLQGGWIERMFMARVPKWLRTHPKTDERVRRLMALEGERAREAEHAGYWMGPLFERPVVVAAPRWHWPGLWY